MLILLFEIFWIFLVNWVVCVYIFSYDNKKGYKKIFYIEGRV